MVFYTKCEDQARTKAVKQFLLIYLLYSSNIVIQHNAKMQQSLTRESYNNHYCNNGGITTIT